MTELDWFELFDDDDYDFDLNIDGLPEMYDDELESEEKEEIIIKYVSNIYHI